MTADHAPDVPRRWVARERPNAGVAWAGAWAFLADGRSAPRFAVINAMQKASPISFRTARDILIQAVQEGTLEVTARDRFGRPTLKRPQ